MAPLPSSLRALLRPIAPSLHKFLQFGPSSTSIAQFAKASGKDPPASKNSKKKKEKARKDKKKAAKSAAPVDGEQERRRFDDLVNKALDAPSPVRHVKAKEREREKELAKYGLMTQERQIELEQEKAREKAKKKAGGAIEGSEEKPPLTAEEGMRLAKEYSRLLMREERKRAAGESLRLRLKKAAIEALPPKLKDAALVPDYTPFPGLCPATLTPPIPGFHYEYDTQAEEF